MDFQLYFQKSDSPWVPRLLIRKLARQAVFVRSTRPAMFITASNTMAWIKTRQSIPVDCRPLPPLPHIAINPTSKVGVTFEQIM